ncbi:hypothetical protein KSB_28890 [Ktedonobacter robiniae]|uniref:Uncharacterized protein n=1 Tax=Ktedonobacter robiniae TaxID=2778365 RepID=A0ABQ3UNU8_9CHLR|nr:hypothetical protein KSB_28890 [Ktedonobacter robiniae]
MRCRLLGDSEGVGKQDHAGQESNDEEHSLQLPIMLTSVHDDSLYAQLTMMLTSVHDGSSHVM